MGIEPEHLSRVFDPFFTTKPKGTGLGLTTSYSIAQRHHGNLSLESSIGRGTTATLYLPAVPRVAREERGSSTSLVIPCEEGGRVLLMDDEAVVRHVATDVFAHLGYQVDCVANGQEAVDRYRRSYEEGEPFDIVILDLTVPGAMGGVEAVRHLLAIDPHVHAIVSSGYCDDPVMADFSRYGFRDRVMKPYQVDEIAGKISAVRRRSSGSQRSTAPSAPP
jgi:CheY-like chemotaxis protein